MKNQNMKYILIALHADIHCLRNINRVLIADCFLDSVV